MVGYYLRCFLEVLAQRKVKRKLSNEQFEKGTFAALAWQNATKAALIRKGSEMADRVVEKSDEEVPEIPEILEKVLLYTLDEAKQKLAGGDDLVPFTALVVKDNLFIESHPGDTTEECYAQAKHTVENARGADAYALCYDGYVETDDGDKDTIIAEGGIPGDPVGYAAGYLYTVDENGVYTFEEEPAYIGEAPNYMEHLNDADSYSEEDIDERYLDSDEFTEGEDVDFEAGAEETLEEVANDQE